MVLVKKPKLVSGSAFDVADATRAHVTFRLEMATISCIFARHL